MNEEIMTNVRSEEVPLGMCIDKLAEALAKAQGQMDSAKKDANNPFFKSKYADLASVIEAIKKPLSENGLSYVQLITRDDHLVTVLMHTSGQNISSTMKIKPTKSDMQGMGSAITYARRYTLQSIVGLPAEDDDGNAASKKVSGSGSSSPKEAPKPIQKEEVVSKNDKIEKVLQEADLKFKDRTEFQVWRVENNYNQDIYAEKEESLLEIFKKVKAMKC